MRSDAIAASHPGYMSDGRSGSLADQNVNADCDSHDRFAPIADGKINHVKTVARCQKKTNLLALPVGGVAVKQRISVQGE